MSSDSSAGQGLPRNVIGTIFPGRMELVFYPSRGGMGVPPGVHSDWDQILRPDRIGTQNDNEGRAENDNEGRAQNDSYGRVRNDIREVAGWKETVTPGHPGVTVSSSSGLVPLLRWLCAVRIMA